MGHGVRAAVQIRGRESSQMRWSESTRIVHEWGRKHTKRYSEGEKGRLLRCMSSGQKDDWVSTQCVARGQATYKSKPFPPLGHSWIDTKNVLQHWVFLLLCKKREERRMLWLEMDVVLEQRQSNRREHFFVFLLFTFLVERFSLFYEPPATRLEYLSRCLSR